MEKLIQKVLKQLLAMTQYSWGPRLSCVCFSTLSSSSIMHATDFFFEVILFFFSLVEVQKNI
jgi:hypothetical protein